MNILTVFRFVLFLCTASFVPTESLVCYDCKNIVNTTECRSITTCGQGEACFMDRITTGNTTLFTLGCTSNTQCNTHTGSGAALVGRSLTARQVQRCHECCSTDICALQLCAHKTPTSCIDDETLDCPHLNTVLDLCADVSHAKHVCPRFCGLCNIVDGKWSLWNAWTKCSVSCETGTQTRTRECNNPPPSHGGEDCIGHYTEIKKCVNGHCPVHAGWSVWMSWGDCSTSCGVGIRRRFRSCTNPPPSIFGDLCMGANVDDKLCSPGACSVDGQWESWGKWSACTETCGGGTQRRVRACVFPQNVPHGHICTGAVTEDRACYNATCLLDCLDIKSSNSSATSGVYTIHLPRTQTNVQVYCDMVTDGGGWTVFQKRFDGTVDFYENFTEYENGFGNITGEFWLGLKTIHELTSLGRSELRIDLSAADGSHAYELFQNFSVSPGRNYTLHIDPGTGTAGDSNGMSYHNGQNFYTKDNDHNDCARSQHGGWWYDNCVVANLNGLYAASKYVGGSWYYSFKQDQSLNSTRMMLRRNK